MYTRWLYTNKYNPCKNIEVRRYACGHYYIRRFISSSHGDYIFDVGKFKRTNKENLKVILFPYTLFVSEVITNENKQALF